MRQEGRVLPSAVRLPLLLAFAQYEVPDQQHMTDKILEFNLILLLNLWIRGEVLMMAIPHQRPQMQWKRDNDQPYLHTLMMMMIPTMTTMSSN